MTLFRELPEVNRDKFVDLTTKQQDAIRTTFLAIGTRAQLFITVILLLGIILVSVPIQTRQPAPHSMVIALACFLSGLVSLGFLHAMNFETSRLVLMRATNRLRQIFRSEVAVEAADTPPISLHWMYVTSALAYLAFLLWIVGAAEAFSAVSSHDAQTMTSVRLPTSELALGSAERPLPTLPQSSAIVLGTQREQTKWSTSDTVAAVSGIVAFLQFLALIATYAVMRGTARRQLRAYTSPNSVSLWEGTTLTPPVPGRENHPGVVLEIKNFGQTPAFRMVSWGTLVVIEPINEDKLVVPQLAQISAQTLPPNGTSTKTLWFDRALTTSEMEDIRQGVRLIYYHGRIEYVDVYGKARYTNFRVAYKGPFPPVGTPVMSFSNHGNESN
jgi:hypothetical protein